MYSMPNGLYLCKETIEVEWNEASHFACHWFACLLHDHLLGSSIPNPYASLSLLMFFWINFQDSPWWTGVLICFWCVPRFLAFFEASKRKNSYHFYVVWSCFLISLCYTYFKNGWRHFSELDNSKIIVEETPISAQPTFKLFWTLSALFSLSNAWARWATSATSGALLEVLRMGAACRRWRFCAVNGSIQGVAGIPSIIFSVKRTQQLQAWQSS